MLTVLRRFLADEDGYLVAQDWAILASVLLLGSVLALMAAQPSAPAADWPLTAEPILPPRTAQIAPVEEPPPAALPGT